MRDEIHRDYLLTPAMTVGEYTDAALVTAIYHGRGEYPGLAYAALGLCNQVAELEEEVIWMSRDRAAYHKDYSAHFEAFASEAADVMWYAAALGAEAAAVAKTRLPVLEEHAICSTAPPPLTPTPGTYNPGRLMKALAPIKRGAGLLAGVVKKVGRDDHFELSLENADVIADLLIEIWQALAWLSIETSGGNSAESGQAPTW